MLWIKKLYTTRMSIHWKQLSFLSKVFLSTTEQYIKNETSCEQNISRENAVVIFHSRLSEKSIQITQIYKLKREMEFYLTAFSFRKKIMSLNVKISVFNVFYMLHYHYICIKMSRQSDIDLLHYYDKTIVFLHFFLLT